MIRSKHVLEGLAAAVMVVALSACTAGSTGGGGDILGGNVPVSDEPQYADDDTKLADAPNGTEFPLLQTQGYYRNNSGKVTDGPGVRKASITPLADGMRLKVEDFVDVRFSDDAHRSVEDDVVTYAKGVEGRLVVLQLYGALVPGLDYMELGAWAVTNNDTTDVGFGVGVGGYETHPNRMPTTGTATYEGTMVGVSVDKNTGNAYDLIGEAKMSANFLTGDVTGTFRNTWATEVGSNPLPSSPWNDVDFEGGITSNEFNGTTKVTGGSNTPGGLSAGAEGTIAGKFFGPDADEAGGAWTLEDSDGTVATGAFAGTQP